MAPTVPTGSAFGHQSILLEGLKVFGAGAWADVLSILLMFRCSDVQKLACFLMFRWGKRGGLWQAESNPGSIVVVRMRPSNYFFPASFHPQHTFTLLLIFMTN